jgi:hypothetical protein
MISHMKALVLVALTFVPAATAASPARVIDSDSIGAYKITQSRERAMAVFGAPTFSRDGRKLDYEGVPEREISFCITAWRSLGLIVWYHNACSSAGRAYRATAEGPGWRTREGLRVGDGESRIGRVYRGARKARATPPAKAQEWILIPLGVNWDLRRAHPTSGVIVATQSGRVVGFELRAASLR